MSRIKVYEADGLRLSTPLPTGAPDGTFTGASYSAWAGLKTTPTATPTTATEAESVTESAGVVTAFFGNWGLDPGTYEVQIVAEVGGAPLTINAAVVDVLPSLVPEP